MSLTDRELGALLAEMQHGKAAVEALTRALDKHAVEDEAFAAFVAKTYATQEALRPVRTIVYGALRVILTTVLLALLALVVVKSAGGIP